MNTNAPGFLITVEGGEGSGKTSHIPQVVEYLRDLGLKIFDTREPGGTPIGEQIRDVIHDRKNEEMNPRAETLLYQAARAQIVDQVLKPKLALGEIVLLDRFYDSTVAYQGYGHKQNVNDLKPLIHYATNGLIPDLTVLLDVDAEIGLSRRSKGGEWNRLDNMALEFHRRVNQAYREIAQQETNRWVVIDANQGYDEVLRDFKSVVREKLEFYSILEGGLNTRER